MEKYLIEGYYDENNNFIAEIRENTPKEIIEQFKEKYDIVEYQNNRKRN